MFFMLNKHVKPDIVSFEEKNAAVFFYFLLSYFLLINTVFFHFKYENSE